MYVHFTVLLTDLSAPVILSGHRDDFFSCKLGCQSLELLLLCSQLWNTTAFSLTHTSMVQHQYIQQLSLSPTHPWYNINSHNSFLSHPHIHGTTSTHTTAFSLTHTSMVQHQYIQQLSLSPTHPWYNINSHNSFLSHPHIHGTTSIHTTRS